MHPRLNVATLAVRNVKTSLDFYRDGLGPPGKIGTEYIDSVSGASGAVAFFDLQRGLIVPRILAATPSGTRRSPTPVARVRSSSAWAT